MTMDPARRTLLTVLPGLVAGAPVATGAPGSPGSSEWVSGPMSISELRDLLGLFLEHGVHPATPMAIYVDGRPGQPGPALLRRVTWIKPEMGVPAGSRLHLVRHAGGPGGEEVVTLG